MQHMRAEGGGEIGLAGAGRPDAEHQRIVAHQIQIGALRRDCAGLVMREPAVRMAPSFAPRPRCCRDR